MEDPEAGRGTDRSEAQAGSPTDPVLAAGPSASAAKEGAECESKEGAEGPAAAASSAPVEETKGGPDDCFDAAGGEARKESIVTQSGLFNDEESDSARFGSRSTTPESHAETLEVETPSTPSHATPQRSERNVPISETSFHSASTTTGTLVASSGVLNHDQQRPQQRQQQGSGKLDGSGNETVLVASDSSSRSRSDVRKVNRFGIFVDEKSETDLLAQARWKSRAKRRTDQRRENKWLHMVQPHNTPDRKPHDSWREFAVRNPAVVKRRIRKGIPDSLRALMWLKLCDADIKKANHPGRYQELCSRAVAKSTEDQIKKDKKRTLQNHVMFRNQVDDPDLDADQGLGQNQLFAVLKACSLQHPVVGYCQAMSSPAAMLVSYMPEEDAFWVLSRVLDHKKYWTFGDIYREGFPLLFEFFYIHNRLLKSRSPKLFKHLLSHEVCVDGYATRWYTTLFSSFPMELVLRIWDIFLHEGVKILFRVAMAVLLHFRGELLSESLEGIFGLIQQLPSQPWLQNADAVIIAALEIDLKTKHLLRLRRQYEKEPHKHKDCRVGP